MIRWLRRAFANWLRPMDAPDLGLTEADLEPTGWDAPPISDDAQAAIAAASLAEYAYRGGR